MNNPINYLSGLHHRLNTIEKLLLSKNDNKADILVMLPEMKEVIKKIEKAFFEYQNAEEQKQQKYFDEVIFEFAPDNKFEDGIHRNLKGMMLDMKDIKNWINAERRLMNKNDEYLHARITLIDYDAEDMPDSEKIED